ncbi:hypothetical protein EVAR_21594_1 [Eumeta japonica]|uniref:Uncharacterized protein n=1 Tax=Eumeta variegata TaxID=151549 RepID=A0A4C1UYQ2_EUMVA|nr:hypothetical protein EVAR_21594_1 [Eumeta japonica]
MADGTVKSTKNGRGSNGDAARSSAESPPPPDGGWGWMVVFASFMIHIVIGTRRPASVVLDNGREFLPYRTSTRISLKLRTDEQVNAFNNVISATYKYTNLLTGIRPLDTDLLRGYGRVGRPHACRGRFVYLKILLALLRHMVFITTKENGLARPVRFHTLVEYRNETSASTVRFIERGKIPVAHTSSVTLLSLHQPAGLFIRPFLPLKDTLPYSYSKRRQRTGNSHWVASVHGQRRPPTLPCMLHSCLPLDNVIKKTEQEHVGPCSL